MRGNRRRVEKDGHWLYLTRGNVVHTLLSVWKQGGGRSVYY
jgi:hypothetical protein